MKVSKQYGFWKSWWMTLVGSLTTESWRIYSVLAALLMFYLGIDFSVAAIIVTAVFLVVFLPWRLIDIERAAWYIECEEYAITWRGCGYMALTVLAPVVMSFLTGHYISGVFFSGVLVLFGSVWAYGWYTLRKMIRESIAESERRIQESEHPRDAETRQMSEDAFSVLTTRRFPRNVD